ncbi:MAG: hypothetical protein MJE68_27780 [Proteobacteria bacterium]|nr:hypothetical protein [Pseudomonadota bacterium]
MNQYPWSLSLNLALFLYLSPSLSPPLSLSLSLFPTPSLLLPGMSDLACWLRVHRNLVTGHRKFTR